MAKKWNVGATVRGSKPRGNIPDGTRWEITERHVETGRPLVWRLVDRGSELTDGPPLFDGGEGLLDKKPPAFVPPTYSSMVEAAQNRKDDEKGEGSSSGSTERR